MMQNTIRNFQKAKPGSFFHKHPLLRFVSAVFKHMNEPFYTGIAAELAFFFLFSIVPLIIVLTELLGVFSISLHALTDIIVDYTTPEFAETLLSFISYKPSGTINIIFALFALWAASKAQFTMVRVSNYSYGYERYGIKGFLLTRLRAIVTVFTMLIVISFMLVILVYGESIIHLIELYLNQYLQIPFILSKFWYLLRWPFSLALIFVGLLYNYGVITSGRVRFRKVIPGSIFATVAMVLSSALYSSYVSIYANYDLLYGSLAAIVSLLFWFYILGYILVLGIQINITWEEFHPHRANKDI